GGETIPAGVVVWAAGVKASAAARWLGVEGDRMGRVPVDGWLEVAGLDGVYVLGDTARVVDEATGEPLPGLAQVAKQQGRWLGRALRRRIARGERGAPFRFRNRGNAAVIGNNAAVFDFGWSRLKGRAAWFLWALVHILLLVSFEKRLLVSVQWAWRYVTRQRGTRLIDEPLPVEPQEEPAPELTEG
ncbi:MAG: FAD-dependent oxidoreductase, partial [Aquamicrobium sp.]|uniref:FAD-dependent oxidoreductase n=1 Tax=Aquamicrobium sp. TaxID=1872579 RepID=UPI00349E8E08|nr:FAD-dependent oxidoreductase [Aquamicrobium sp.]